MQAVKIALGCLGAIAGMFALGGYYLAVCWVFDLLPHAEVETVLYAFGAGLTVVMTLLTAIIGESEIEDGVKFAFAVLAAWFIGDALEPGGQAVVVGAPVGASVSILIRIHARSFQDRHCRRSSSTLGEVSRWRAATTSRR